MGRSMHLVPGTTVTSGTNNANEGEDSAQTKSLNLNRLINITSNKLHVHIILPPPPSGGGGASLLELVNAIYHDHTFAPRKLAVSPVPLNQL